MEADPSEQNSLYESKPEIFKELLAQLTREVQAGRSTKGKASKNDVDGIVLWKSEQPKQNQGKKNRKKKK